jgi:hypothetical protein
MTLSGCGNKNEDLFKDYSLKGDSVTLEKYLIFLDNLSDFTNGVTDELMVFDEDGIRKADGWDEFLDGIYEERTPISPLIGDYIPSLGIHEAFDGLEDEEAVYMINKLYYFGEKLYLSLSDKKENQGKSYKDPIKIVDKYLESISNAEETDGYKFPHVTDFINVIDYKYIKTRDEKEYNDYYILRKSSLEELEFGKFKSIEALKQEIKDKVGLSPEITEHKEDYVKIVLDREIQEYNLIYDVTLTNRKGEKLYKKYLFNVSNDNPQYKLKIRYGVDLSEI